MGVRVQRVAPPLHRKRFEDLRFDLKPPSWCLVQFPKMAAHLLGKRHWKKLQQKYLVWRSSKGKGRQWCSLNVIPKSKNQKGALGETVANALGGWP